VTRVPLVTLVPRVTRVPGVKEVCGRDRKRFDMVVTFSQEWITLYRASIARAR